MPCTYYETPEERNRDAKQAAEHKTELDRAVRLLCSLAGRVPSKYVHSDNELCTWLEKHAEKDRQRVQAEKAALEAKLLELESQAERAEKQAKEARKHLEAVRAQAKKTR